MFAVAPVGFLLRVLDGLHLGLALHDRGLPDEDGVVLLGLGRDQVETALFGHGLQAVVFLAELRVVGREVERGEDIQVVLLPDPAAVAQDQPALNRAGDVLGVPALDSARAAAEERAEKRGGDGFHRPLPVRPFSTGS